ncbi:MAG: YgjV family protein [Firmicutes bacterium]|nr:YgjV family protein [Bacillota bacterium]
MLSLLTFALPTTTEGWIYEIVGIVASLFVLISFIWSNEKITRIINMVGCVVFVVYAALIGSISVGIMNGACFLLHVVKLIKIEQNKRKAAVSDKAAEDVDKQEALSEQPSPDENSGVKGE